MRRARRRLLARPAVRAVTLGLLLGAVGAEGQGPAAPDFEGTRRPGDESLPLPAFPDATPAPAFVLPPVPETDPEEGPLSSQLQVFVRSFVIEGNTVFSPEELEQVVAPYVGRLVSATELRALRRALTLLYVQRGYVTSGVVLPDQTVADGVVRLQAVEGKLARVDVAGERHLRPEYVQSRFLDRDDDGPVNVADLQERLQLLQMDPLIDRVNGQLSPGDRLGESILALDVEEDRPYDLRLGLDNDRNPSVGSLQGQLDATFRNLSGWGDALNVRLRKTEGLIDGLIFASVPLHARGPTLNAGYRAGQSKVVEEPFDQIDVESKFDELVVSLRQPLVRSVRRSLHLSLGLERRRARTFLLGEPFSFVPGPRDGVSRVTVARVVGDWLERRDGQVLALRSTFSVGLDAMGATINDSGPDGRFFTWLGQLQYARRLRGGTELVVRADAQFTPDPLLALERFGVGGATTVRGYRKNLLVRDNGYAASVELRFPVLREVAGIGELQLAVFADTGEAWNDAATPGPRSISSAGGGLRWQPVRGLHTQLYGAVPFRNVDHASDDLQDTAIHFRVDYAL